MGDDIDSGNGQHDLNGGIDRIRVMGDIVVNTLGESIHVRAELWRLQLVPFGAARSSIPLMTTHLSEVQIFRAPIFGCSTACLAVQMDKQVAVALRLRVTKPIEDSRLGFAENVRDAVGVP